MRIACITILLTVLVCIATSFVEKKQAPATTSLAFVVPEGWPQPVYDFSQNPLTKEGFELGRKLFYDGRLSVDGNFPCSSCHQQFAAFATYDHNLSHGVNNSLTTRNAPGLFNLAWQKEFMHDGGINHLDLQPLAPITATNEMGETLNNVLAKLRADTTYRKMFKAAFGDEDINTQKMSKALSQFLLMMVSSNSKYDKVRRGEVSFNLPERLGYDLFKKKCASCHTEPLFSDYTYRNIGVDLDSFINDVGRMRITRLSADSLKFKVPSLRNVMVTAPYLHDGRFYSTYEVFNHYRSSVVKMKNTDSLVRNGIPLSNFEIGQITAFLYTLTDSSFLHDPRFGPPQDAVVPPVMHVH
ncbi:cytochrome c peroxidase [Danxiaibacter flavus]|uniref:Cytochrome c peroxidase n=1 Tax=Danxiaibacter flavus TaxID=3049108 RepID=A0ABV3ZD40_9BACT|nr:cytochrome c peroxidase [Chitinophagaceae bacterium DXS]